LAAVLVLVFAWTTLYRAGPYGSGSSQWGSKVHRTDFSVYRNAGLAVIEGTDLYQVRNQRGWAYVYPPLFSIAMVPFAVLPFPIGVMIWYCISVALTAWAIVMCVQFVGSRLQGRRSKLAATFLPLLLLIVWIASGVQRGQASIPMAFLVIAAVFWEAAKKPALGGACLAGAVLLKVFPLLLLGYYLWRGKWRFVAATLGSLVLGALLLPAIVFGWHRNITYLQEWKQAVAEPAFTSEASRANYSLYGQLFSSEHPRDQSLDAVLYRYSRWGHAAAAAVAIALVSAAAIWLVGRRATPAAELDILAAAMVWMLLVSPVSEDHYFAVLLLPLTIAVAELGAVPDGFLKTLGRGSLWAFGALNIAAVIDRRFEVYGAVFWSGALLLTLMLWLASWRTSEKGWAAPMSVHEAK